MNAQRNPHDQLVEQALVGFDLAAEHHIANCQPCQTERERMQDALREFAVANRKRAHRPEIFWEQQAARIRTAQQRSTHRSRLALTLVPTAVVLLLAAFAVLSPSPVARPTVAKVPTAALQQDSDHQLLLEVERAMQTDTPRSLEALTLLSDESDATQPTESVNFSKESRSHEN